MALDFYNFDPDYLLFILAKTAKALNLPIVEKNDGLDGVVKGRYISGGEWGIGIVLVRAQIRLVRMSDLAVLKQVPSNSFCNFIIDKDRFLEISNKLISEAPKLLKPL